VGASTTDVYGMAVGDLDNDGDLDIVSSSNSGEDYEVIAWQNDGTPFSGLWTQYDVGASTDHVLAVAVGDLDNDGDLDIASGSYSSEDYEIIAWKNIGGSTTLDVTDTSPAEILDGTEDDMLQVVFYHNGIAADRDLELNQWDLDVLQSNCADPLSSAEANAIIDNLRVRLDDGDDVFETDGSDALVTGGDIDTLSLTGGVQTITFSDGDTDVQLDQDVTPNRTYWISVLTTSDASSQTPSGFCLNFDPDADALVEGKTPDFGVSQQDTSRTNANAGTVPTGVELASFSAAPQGGSIRLAWETASELDNLGFNVSRSDSPTGEALRLNAALIPAQNTGSPVGAAYSFVDTSAVPGVAHFYWLEAVDVYGAATLHGPVSAAARYRVYLPLVVSK